LIDQLGKAGHTLNVQIMRTYTYSNTYAFDDAFGVLKKIFAVVLSCFLDDANMKDKKSQMQMELKFL
jgi:hypothetical protein